MTGIDAARRQLVIGVGIASAGLLVTGSAGLARAADKGKGKGQEKEVGAVEDLMREHGVLRRTLLVYIESVPKLRANAAGVPSDALSRTAKLFRTVGEDYHERRLKETYIFPAVKKRAAKAQAMWTYSRRNMTGDAKSSITFWP